MVGIMHVDLVQKSIATSGLMVNGLGDIGLTSQGKLRIMSRLARFGVGLALFPSVAFSFVGAFASVSRRFFNVTDKIAPLKT